MLDSTDHRILDLLLRNGRVSFATIGHEVGLSPHGAADRVRRLQRSGVITGFTATLAMDRVGRGLDALVDVRLLPHTAPDDFERFVLGLVPVTEITFVTGRFDYVVRVACDNADSLDQVVRDIRRDGGAAHTETRIVLRAARRHQRVSELEPAPLSPAADSQA